MSMQLHIVYIYLMFLLVTGSNYSPLQKASIGAISIALCMTHIILSVYLFHI